MSEVSVCSRLLTTACADVGAGSRQWRQQSLGFPATFKPDKSNLPKAPCSERSWAATEHPQAPRELRSRGGVAPPSQLRPQHAAYICSAPPEQRTFGVLPRRRLKAEGGPALGPAPRCRAVPAWRAPGASEGARGRSSARAHISGWREPRMRPRWRPAMGFRSV